MLQQKNLTLQETRKRLSELERQRGASHAQILIGSSAVGLRGLNSESSLKQSLEEHSDESSDSSDWVHWFHYAACKSFLLLSIHINSGRKNHYAVKHPEIVISWSGYHSPLGCPQGFPDWNGLGKVQVFLRDRSVIKFANDRKRNQAISSSIERKQTAVGGGG